MMIGKAEPGASGSRHRRLATTALATALLLLLSLPTAARADDLKAQQVSAGADFTCALTSESRVLCWGYNSGGQLGDGTTEDHFLPQPVSGLGDAKAIVSGSAHSCALRVGGSVVCWGENEFGQLGDGSLKDRRLPTPVAGLADVASIAAGSASTCAIRKSGQALCWGDNSDGQIGIGEEEELSTRPAEVVGLGQVAAIDVGLNLGCAIDTAGEALCWGIGYEPDDPTDEEEGDPATAMPVPGADHGRRITAGDAHACLLRAQGDVRCWGADDEGQLGNGPGSDSLEALTVPGIEPGVEIAAGDRHTCIVTAQGGAWCWGADDERQLGGGADAVPFGPVKVKGLVGAVDIAPGGGHTCAARAAAGVVCWGSNESGQLGDGTDEEREEPIIIDRPARPAALGQLKVKPARKNLRRGRKLVATVTVRNVGEAATGSVLVCGRAPRRLVAMKACLKVGALSGGNKAKVRFPLKLKRAAVGGRRIRVTFIASASGQPAKSGFLTLKVK